MKQLKFFVITDTHYFKNSLGAYGEEYDKFMHFEQKCFAETQSINEALFSYLEQAEQADIVLIAGDLTFNGEKESHLDFIRLLNSLKSHGKKVCIITADHDYNDYAKAYDNNGVHNIEAVLRDKLFDLYYDFGFSDAIAVDRKHLSYVSQLSENVRLLALNNDGDCKKNKTYDDEQIAWIKEQTKKAREDGQMMIAMNHYPLIAGQPIFSVISSAVQKNADEITNMLADEGVHIVFTGHMHNQSINEKISPSGNKFYDVCTGSVIASPSVMRLVTVVDEATVKIETLKCPDFDWDTSGKSCEQYLKDLFDGMIMNVLNDLKTNPQGVLSRISVKDNPKLYSIMRYFGKKSDTFTVGKTCRLFFVKCDKSIKNVLLKDYSVNLVRNAFTGNQPYIGGTAEGDAFLGVLKRLKPIFRLIKLKDSKGNRIDIYDVLKNTAGNYGIDDYNAVLKLK